MHQRRGWGVNHILHLYHEQIVTMERKGGVNMSYWDVRLFTCFWKRISLYNPSWPQTLSPLTFQVLRFQERITDHRVSPRYRVVTAHIALMGFGETKWEKTAGCVSKTERASNPFNFLVNCLPGCVTVSAFVWVKKPGSIKQSGCMDAFSFPLLTVTVV